MQTLQLIDNGGVIFLRYVLLFFLLVVTAKGYQSCRRLAKEGGWRITRADIAFRMIVTAAILLLIGVAGLFVQWLSSGQSYYAVSFDRNHVVLRFDWPVEDVVLNIADVHSASYSDKWTRRGHRGRLTIESTRGTHDTLWGRNHATMKEAAEQITKLKREARERHEPFTQPEISQPLTMKRVMLWRWFEWTAWSIGLAAFVVATVLVVRVSPFGGLRRSPGRALIGFSVCVLAALGLTLFTPVSKLHLFWFLPISFAASLSFAFRTGTKGPSETALATPEAKNIRKD